MHRRQCTSTQEYRQHQSSYNLNNYTFSNTDASLFLSSCCHCIQCTYIVLCNYSPIASRSTIARQKAGFQERRGLSSDARNAFLTSLKKLCTTNSQICTNLLSSYICHSSTCQRRHDSHISVHTSLTTLVLKILRWFQELGINAIQSKPIHWLSKRYVLH